MRHPETPPDDLNGRLAWLADEAYHRLRRSAKNNQFMREWELSNYLENYGQLLIQTLGEAHYALLPEPSEPTK
jgi:hypothetical protein